MNPDPIAGLIKLLARLPGIGGKNAARLAYFLFQAPGNFAEDLAQAILTVRETVKPCPECGLPSAITPCAICADPERNHEVIMVVEDPQDLTALEKTKAFRGVYHVLGGALSPLAGRGPENLRVHELIERVKPGKIREVILATNPSVEGDATAAFLEETLAACGQEIVISRLARGVPIGSELRYLDALSLEQALQGRKTKN